MNAPASRQAELYNRLIKPENLISYKPAGLSAFVALACSLANRHSTVFMASTQGTTMCTDGERYPKLRDPFRKLRLPDNTS
jgi:hypothetical protein